MVPISCNQHNKITQAGSCEIKAPSVEDRRVPRGTAEKNKCSPNWMAEMRCGMSQKEHFIALIKGQGSAKKDDGSNLSQSLLCIYNKTPGSR